MKIGLLDATPELRGSVPLKGGEEEEARVVMSQPEQNTGANPPRFKEIDGRVFSDGAPVTWGASGLAAVWAEENTRGAIYDAFRRKETFATTGTRIKLRFFAGHGFNDANLDDSDLISKAYAEGVSMGSELLASAEQAPSFIAWASRDALSAPLQRLQIIKGWTENGEHHEQVYDIACSDGAKVDPATHRCPDNGAEVNLTDCSFSRNLGESELKATWTDPDANPDHHAFYYARVLENPTCRWPTWDALRAGEQPRPDFPSTIQERAWSSPIWIRPAG